MNNYFSVLLVVLIGFSACQGEPEKKVVHQKPPISQIENQKTVVESETFATDELKETDAAINKASTEKPESPATEVKKEKPAKKSKPKTKPTPKPKKPAKKEEKLSADLVSNSKTASKNKKEKKGPLPELVFDYKTYDFGIVNHGDTVTHQFYFVNEGDAPAIISEASSSCGCTIPDYPKKPIKPGQRAYIKAVFATKGKLNTQKKSITIKANTEPNYTTLYLTGEVYNRPKKKEPVDSTKLDSIKKALKKAQKDSLKLKKKADAKQSAEKEKAKAREKDEKTSLEEKAKDKLTEAKEKVFKENKKGESESEEIDYFLPMPNPKKTVEEKKKEKP